MRKNTGGGVFNDMIRAPRIYYNCFYYTTIVVNISYKTQNILKFLSSSCLSSPSTHTHTHTNLFIYKACKCFFTILIVALLKDYHQITH